MTINKRHYLNDLLDYLNMSINAFEKEIGAGTGTISKVVNGTEDRELSIKTIRKIIAKYPDINQSWLQTGEGSMFLTTSDKVKGLAQETGKPHGEDKNTGDLTDYLLKLTIENLTKRVEDLERKAKEKK